MPLPFPFEHIPLTGPAHFGVEIMHTLGLGFYRAVARVDKRTEIQIRDQDKEAKIKERQ